MKHDVILAQLVTDAEKEPNVLGLLVFGSVARGTQRENSDIDVITVLQSSKPASGIHNTTVEGIKVGDLYLTYEVLIHSVENVPYLLHPLEGAKLLFERDGLVHPVLARIREYYLNHPEIAAEWNKYYSLLQEEKAQFGYEQTTIVDVWNDLERRYASGKTKRRFFNAFYMTNPLIFSLLKKLM